jgi:hypothetical protein
LGTIAAGGRGATRGDIVGAVEQVRRAAAVRNIDLRAKPSGPWRSAKRRRQPRNTTAGQLTLPLVDATTP